MLGWTLFLSLYAVGAIAVVLLGWRSTRGTVQRAGLVTIALVWLPVALVVGILSCRSAARGG